MASNRNLGFDVNAPGTAVFIIQLIFLALAWIASLMRAFVKIVLLRKVTLDDYLMLIALLGYTTTAYFVFSAVIDGGLGRPATELSLESAEISLRSWYGNMTVSGPVSGLIRISIALFLSRIAIKKWHRLVLHTIIGLSAVMTFVYFFVVLLQCSPISYFWEKVRNGSSGTCHYLEAVYVSTLVYGSFGAVMDWVLGLLPIAILWHVRINRRTKVGIAALLSSGIIAGIALIIRVIYIGQFGAASPRMAVYGTLAVSITAIVELSLGIIAGCIATLPPLFKRLGLSFGDSSNRGKSGSLTDTIPWQRSFAGPEPRPRGAESIILMSPRRLESAQDIDKEDFEVQSTRVHSPSARRALSPSQWDIDIERETTDDDDDQAPPPSGKEIKVRTFIRVTSQPSDEAVAASTAHFIDKPLPLPPPPPRPKTRDRPIARSRPLTPKLLF
ncbi:hypothetical protein F5Y19DRAFT_82829 [Xylariaceae sp. FL1651]|nr:hypothetical protein F5Y19DRAFT_82829 [Xylariaceae sp. FL1651]